MQGIQDRDGSFKIICRALQIRLHDNNPTVALKGLIVAHYAITKGPFNDVLAELASYGTLNLRVVSKRSHLPQNLTRYATYLDRRISLFNKIGHDVIKAKIDDAPVDNKPASFEAKRMSTLTVQDGLLTETKEVRLRPYSFVRD